MSDEIIGYDYEGNEVYDGEIIENEVEELTDQWKLIAYHLQNNHYPAVPLSMVDICIEAIEKAELGEWDSLIKLPDGTQYKGEDSTTVEIIVESHHLHDFIKNTEKEVITIKDDEGTIIIQGYGETLTLSPDNPSATEEPAADIDANPEAYGIEQ